MKSTEERRLKQSKEFEEKFNSLLKSAEKNQLIREHDAKSLQDYHKAQMEERHRVSNFYHNEDKKDVQSYYGPKEKGRFCSGD